MTRCAVRRGDLAHAAVATRPTIIMLTGDGAPEPSAAVLATHGIDHYFTKPFDDQEVLELLDGLEASR